MAAFCLRGHCISTVLALLFLATALGTSGTMGIVEGREEMRLRQTENEYREESVLPGGRRRLNGPGSSPPTCRGRCGWCYPCRPVHVAIQPGRSVPMEYYPEAWRCKCGNKLYMP